LQYIKYVEKAVDSFGNNLLLDS